MNLFSSISLILSPIPARCSTDCPPVHQPSSWCLCLGSVVLASLHYLFYLFLGAAYGLTIMFFAAATAAASPLPSSSSRRSKTTERGAMWPPHHNSTMTTTPTITTKRQASVARREMQVETATYSEMICKSNCVFCLINGISARYVDCKLCGSIRQAASRQAGRLPAIKRKFISARTRCWTAVELGVSVCYVLCILLPVTHSVVVKIVIMFYHWLKSCKLKYTTDINRKYEVCSFSVGVMLCPLELHGPTCAMVAVTV